MKITITDALTTVPGVGPEIRDRFRSVGIETISDLFDYWPRRYEDYSRVLPIDACIPGPLTIKATLSLVKSRYVRRGMHITEALARDNSGAMRIVWFNQPYRSKSLKLGVEYFISGDFDVHSGRLSLANPTLLEFKPNETNTLVVPVYPETKLISSNLIRRVMKKIRYAIDDISETLPPKTIKDNALLSRSEAIFLLHFPHSIKDLAKAQERLAFEELFQMLVATASTRKEILHEKAPRVAFELLIAQKAIDDLPFQLTDDQRRSLWQIYKDLEKDTPMNRMLEGDVGSGKTAVAALASLMVLRAGLQVLFMAPTEILAKQHAESLSNFFKNTDYDGSVGLLTGSLKKKAKTNLHKEIEDGNCKIVVGTHAIIQDSVATKNVGLVIVDEQHRFGVNQRQKLRQKGGLFPHFLAMTATPIPRSLTLTLYGEVDLSIIQTMPVGRKQTITKITPFAARHALYQEVDKEIEAGNQLFIVCPLIQESEALSVVAVEKIYDEVRMNQLKRRSIAVLHGKMKSEEKEKVMQSFREGKIDVLVATTVIEVGVDIPNANIMIIEGAERFGLAQIHQLRGRVGRGGAQGYCHLIPSQDIGETKRLRAVVSTSSGFKLAELDLDLRGPGAIYGTRQSGVLDLRMAKFDDRKMIMRAKVAADAFIDSGENMVKYVELSARVKHFQSLTKLN